MKSNLIAVAVLAASALTSFGASAQVYNSWLFDQAQPSSTARVEANVVDQPVVPGFGAAVRPAVASTGTPAPALTRAQVKGELLQANIVDQPVVPGFGADVRPVVATSADQAPAGVRSAALPKTAAQ